MSREFEKLLPLAPRDFLILFALSEGERHGYSIVKEAEDHSGSVYLDPANLYRSLRRMRRLGLVRDAGLVVDASEGAPRRYFGLTAFGRRVLAAEAARLARLTDEARMRKLIPDKGGSR
jgi:DNA-binding PadR family transcriptional regulator